MTKSSGHHYMKILLLWEVLDTSFCGAASISNPLHAIRITDIDIKSMTPHLQRNKTYVYNFLSSN